MCSRRAATEQSLYDALPAALQELAGSGEANVEVGGYQARVTRSELRAPGERLTAALREALGVFGADDRLLTDPAVTLLLRDMEDLFFVMQLFSYPADYLLDEPTVERLAETLDKFEEDVLQRDYPSVRGRRRASIRFVEPIPVNAQGKRDQVAELTRLMQDGVQGLLDELNGVRRSAELARMP